MNKNILKKITKYTAASAAALASAGSAEATIVYGDIDPNALVDTTGGSFHVLDLNYDGQFDFYFQGDVINSNWVLVRGFGSVSSASIGGSNNAIAGSSNYSPSQFNTSGSVGTSANSWLTGGITGNNDIALASFYSGSDFGFLTGSDHYMGVRFDIAGQLHYGWVRLNSTIDVANGYVSVTLLDYAYEDCPGVAIPVGTPVGGSACAAIEDVALVDNHEYTQMPFKQADGMDLSVVIDNPGTVDVTDAVVTTEVYLAPNFTTPVQTIVSGNNSITAGSSTTFNNGTFAPTTNGSYGILHYVNSTAFGVDNDATNDTVGYLMDVGASFARDNDNNLGGSIGIGAGAAENAVLGSNYTLRLDADIDSVDVFIVNGAAGNTMVGQPLTMSIYNTSLGIPNAVVHTTDAITVTTAGPHWERLAVTGGPVNLAAGEYFFGLEEADSNLTLGVTASIFTPGTEWINWDTSPFGTWANPETFGAAFEDAYMIRPHFSTCASVAFTDTPIITCDSSEINGAMYFTSQTVVDTLVGANACGGDSIVTTQLTINNSATSSENLTACTSATFNGNTYTTSQVVVDVLTGAAASGCDSTHTTNLTINSPVTENRSLTACNTITFNGNTYTTTQMVTDFFPSGAANGCDSTLITDLVVSSFAQTNYNFDGCGMVTAYGVNYTTSQVVRDTLIGGSVAGCDSITVQNITVNMPSTSSENMTTCDSAVINGVTYTTSQVVSDLFVGGAANGCDSTHTTTLTINNAVTSNESLDSCGSAMINGTMYTTSQMITELFPAGAANGCDSTHNIDLTINNATFSSQVINACDSYTINGNTYTTGGLKVDTIIGGAANGCDSIVATTLDLGYTASTTIDTSLAIGETITIDSIVYDVSGTYSVSFEKPDGCDSTVTYNVTIATPPNGINDENQLTSTSVYPNPTNGIISINSFTENISVIRVMDIQGKELFIQNNLNAKMNEIDMTSLESGIYFVKIELTNGVTEIAKIVKTEKK